MRPQAQPVHFAVPLTVAITLLFCACAVWRGALEPPGGDREGLTEEASETQMEEAFPAAFPHASALSEPAAAQEYGGAAPALVAWDWEPTRRRDVDLQSSASQLRI